MRKYIFLSLAFVLSLACSCGEKQGSDTPDPSPVAPTAITLSQSSWSVSKDGGELQVTITSPSRPKVEIPTDAKSWLSCTDGIFKDYKITVTLKAASNTEYEVRSADVTVSATGVESKKISVSQAANEVTPDPELPDNTAVKRTRELGLGWNLGNHFDAYENGVAKEDAWDGVLATQATFTGVKAKGFSSVRIPVTWLGHIGDAPDYILDQDWLNRVYTVVGYAKNAGLKVIINTHHDEDRGDGHWQSVSAAVNSEDANTQIKEEIAAVWKQIATKFKDEGDYLMLESFNELGIGTWAQVYTGNNPEKGLAIINQWNQVFVDAVRSTGGNNSTRWLGVPGYAANPKYMCDVPNDPANKTMLAFHSYDPYDYTIGDAQLADWGHTGKLYKNGEEEIKALFSGIYNNYIAKNIPVYMGEFGCSIRDKNAKEAWAFYLYYLEYFVKCAKVYGISPFLWDNGAAGAGVEHHPYIHHGTGEYMATGEEPVKAMVKAWSTSDASYTLQSIYDSAPKF